jgi:hypothetical protein
MYSMNLLDNDYNPNSSLFILLVLMILFAGCTPINRGPVASRPDRYACTLPKLTAMERIAALMVENRYQITAVSPEIGVLEAERMGNDGIVLHWSINVSRDTIRLHATQTYPEKTESPSRGKVSSTPASTYDFPLHEFYPAVDQWVLPIVDGIQGICAGG